MRLSLKTCKKSFVSSPGVRMTFILFESEPGDDITGTLLANRGFTMSQHRIKNFQRVIKKSSFIALEGNAL